MTSETEAASTKATAFPFPRCAACLRDQTEVNASQGDVTTVYIVKHKFTVIMVF